MLDQNQVLTRGGGGGERELLIQKMVLYGFERIYGPPPGSARVPILTIVLNVSE